MILLNFFCTLFARLGIWDVICAGFIFRKQEKHEIYFIIKNNDFLNNQCLLTMAKMMPLFYRREVYLIGFNQGSLK